MKNILRNTKALILHLFAVSLLCTNIACSNDDDHTPPPYDVDDEFTTPKFTDDDDCVSGQVGVKFTRDAVDNFTLETKNGRVSTSIAELDKILSGLRISTMERTFKYIPKFEDKAKESGLDLWYVLHFSKNTPVKLVMHHLGKLDMIEILEASYEYTGVHMPDFNTESENIQITIEDTWMDFFPLRLTCQTKTQFISGGYQLITDQSFENNSIKIDFTGVNKPGPGSSFANACSPASSTINLKYFGNGAYEIELNNGNLKNKGTLTITKEKVELQIENPKGINIINPILERTTTN